MTGERDRPELVLDARADLGEGPSWNAAARRLIPVDINARTVHRFDPASRPGVRGLRHRPFEVSA